VAAVRDGDAGGLSWFCGCCFQGGVIFGVFGCKGGVGLYGVERGENEPSSELEVE
jgi:hypothetical protein